MRNDFATTVVLYLLGLVVLFIIGIYIFRSIFNIPSFLRYQRAQIRLLEEMAKKQGVDDTKVKNIISESIGWEGSPSNQWTTLAQQSASSDKPVE